MPRVPSPIAADIQKKLPNTLAGWTVDQPVHPMSRGPGGGMLVFSKAMPDGTTLRVDVDLEGLTTELPNLFPVLLTLGRLTSKRVRLTVTRQ